MTPKEVTGSAGIISARAVSGRGFSADEIADMALAKLVSVSANAPAPIRDQAMAYRDGIRALLVHYIGIAKGAALTDAYNVLRAHGQHDAANIIEKLSRGT